MMKLLLITVLCISQAFASHHDHEKDSTLHYKDGEHDEKYDHEAVLGSKEEEEEFSKMEPEEAKEKLGDLVDKMDTNSDGYVDKKELTSWITNSFKNSKLNEAKKEFKKYDKDEDGFMTWAEFVEEDHSQTLDQLEKTRKGADPDMKEFIKIVADDEAKFDAADLNKDKKLTVEEFHGFFHPQYFAHMFPYELKRKLAEADKNNDGKIDLNEFIVSEAGDESEKQETRDTETTNFKEHDKNKDGVLDHDEMKHWLMDVDDLHDEDLAKEEVQHLFVESLGKEEGEKPSAKLSKDTIVDNHQLWVGSHATDYGKHLQDEL